MFCTEEDVNYILSYSKTLVDHLNQGKTVPRQLKSIQYVVFAGLIAHYGFDAVDTIYKAFSSSNFVYTKDSFEDITKNINISGIQNRNITRVGSFVTLGAKERLDGKMQISRTIYITDNDEYESFDRFLEKVVHEINHVVNSVNKPVVLYHGSKSFRIGMSVSEIGGERGFGRILEESVNVLQTADIMKEILNFSRFKVLDPGIGYVLCRIRTAAKYPRVEGYGYEFTTPIVKELYSNNKFKNLVVGSRLNGLINPIRVDFDSKVGEGCYYRFCDAINAIDNKGRVWWDRSDEEKLASQYIKKYNACK